MYSIHTLFTPLRSSRIARYFHIRYFIIFLLSIALLGYLVYRFNVITQTMNYYYRVLNPQAGVAQLEKIYKDNSDGAESMRIQANFTIDELNNSRDITSLFNTKSKIEGYFIKRETYLSEMLRIDDEARNLHLSNVFGEFYNRRKKADENELAAFVIYRNGVGDILDGILSYSKFFILYNQAIDLMNDMMTGNFTSTTVMKFDNLTLTLGIQYNEVSLLRKRGVFTEDIGDYMEERTKDIKLIRDFNRAWAKGDTKEADRIVAQILSGGTRKTTESSDLIAQWANEKSLPVLEAQDAMHKESWNLYSQTYIYAENERLYKILMVWEGKPPGGLREENLEL